MKYCIGKKGQPFFYDSGPPAGAFSVTEASYEAAIKSPGEYMVRGGRLLKRQEEEESTITLRMRAAGRIEAAARRILEADLTFDVYSLSPDNIDELKELVLTARLAGEEAVTFFDSEDTEHSVSLAAAQRLLTGLLRQRARVGRLRRRHLKQLQAMTKSELKNVRWGRVNN